MSDTFQSLVDEQARAVREHESVRRQHREMKRRRFEAQTLRGSYARTDWRYVQAEKQETDCARAADDLNAKLVEASVVRQRADAMLQAAIAEMRFRGAFIQPPVPEQAPVPPPAPVAPPLKRPNEAQLQHLRLLAVKVRNDELKMRARLDAAHDFIAVAMSIFNGGGK